MASSDVEIANRALDAIGARIITSFEDDTREAGLCRRYYPQLRDAILRSHPWNCAIKRAALAASPTAPTFGWERSFPLPTDCLRVLSVDGDEDTLGNWQVEGRSILTNLSAPLNIRYIFRVTEPGLLDPALVSAIAARLAMELAMPLAGSLPMRQQMQREYVDRIREARSVDGQEGTALQVGAEDFVWSRL